jgi:phage/plasmid-like protein (TIGR03299 family)
MAAHIESLMYTGEIPWHGLGTSVPSHLPWRDAIAVAGLNWSVRMQRVFIRDMRNGTERTAVECEGFRAMVRDSDSAVLGIGTERYQPIQNADAFEVFQAAFGDRAVMETMGSLRGGKEVFGLARIPGDWSIGGDQHRKYLLVSTGHDGRHEMRALPTAVRVVCCNTLGAALRAASKMKKGTFAHGYSVRHIGDVNESLETVKGLVSDAFAQFNGYERRMIALQNATLSNVKLADLLQQLVPGDSGKAETVRDGIEYLSKHGTGNAQWAGTPYGILQGVTEYVDHHKLSKATPERRFLYQTDGAGATLKEHAELVLIETFCPGLLDGPAKVTVAA